MTAIAKALPLRQGTSVLRQRMFENMRIAQAFTEDPGHYIGSVRRLAGYLGLSPDTATVEDLRKYQLHLVDQGGRDSES